MEQPPLPSSDVPVQFMTIDEEVWKDGLDATDQLFDDSSASAKTAHHLACLVPPDLASRLLKLYLQFVHPQLPVLSLHDLDHPQGGKGVLLARYVTQSCPVIRVSRPIRKHFRIARRRLGSLPPIRLSLTAVEILIFLALLRPLVPQNYAALNHENSAAADTYRTCLEYAKTATDFVGSLKARHFGSYWPLCKSGKRPFFHVFWELAFRTFILHNTSSDAEKDARYQLGYFSALLLLLSSHSSTEEVASQTQSLLRRWRDSLRAQARAWPLAKLAAMRLDADFWKKLSAVVHGAGPAFKALRGENS